MGGEEGKEVSVHGAQVRLDRWEKKELCPQMSLACGVLELWKPRQGNETGSISGGNPRGTTRRTKAPPNRVALTGPRNQHETQENFTDQTPGEKKEKKKKAQSKCRNDPLVPSRSPSQPQSSFRGGARRQGLTARLSHQGKPQGWEPFPQVSPSSVHCSPNVNHNKILRSAQLSFQRGGGDADKSNIPLWRELNTVPRRK